MKSTVVIPDTQIRHGVATWHLPLIGAYIADHQPDNVVMLGDWFDQPSISKYASVLEGRRYQKDVDAGIAAMERMLEPVTKVRGYKARFTFITGNHEVRLQKYLNEHPELHGALHDPLETIAAMGWNVVPFLKPVVIAGVTYCHYFPRSASGSVMQSKHGAPNAKAQAQREMRSCTAGHQQGFQYHEHPLNGRIVQSMIAGSCYAHDEHYLTPAGHSYFKGIVHKQHHANGYYDFRKLSLSALKELYK